MERPVLKCIWWKRQGAVPADRSARAAGYSVIEMLVVVLIALITTAIALPLVQNAGASYQMKSAVNAVTGAIQRTRFQAINNGYPYRIVFNFAASTYQVYNSSCGYSSPCWATVGIAEPLSGSSVVPVMSISGAPSATSNTLDFQGGGLVLTPSVTSPAASSLTFNLAFKGLTEAITVSNYGSITVTP
jgi:type II secretory pathway pseudopilin PulG